MGQKVHPHGFRLGVIEDFNSTWFAPKGAQYIEFLHSDLAARNYLEKEFAATSVAKILIKRPAKNALIELWVARPGIVINKKEYLEEVRAKLTKIMNVPIHLSIHEVRKPELSAKIVSQGVAQQLERRVMFRRAMKRAVSTAMRSGALGVKVKVSGRLGGTEIARSEWYREGRVPLHTLRARIDYHLAEAQTTYGVIGVKVWIFKGEVIGDGRAAQKEENTVPMTGHHE